MDKPSLSRQFARWAAHLKYDDLPPAVADKAKALLLHGLAGVVLGSAKPRAREAVAHVLKEEGKADGASVLALGGKATRVGAAFANSELIHLSAHYDSYRMLTHPGVSLIPAALANAELEASSGKELLTALAVGYEFTLRLCDEFIPATAARGYRPSPIYCTMGAALASAKLLRLDEEGLVATIALAASAAAGLFEGARTSGGEGALNDPQAARNGVFTALVASEGHIRGSELALEGEAGFYKVFTGSSRGELSYSFHEGVTRADLNDITRGLGKDWKLLTVMLRMYPFAGYNQPVIDLIVEMMQQHRVAAADIADLSVKMNWIETLYPSPAFPKVADPDQPRVGSTHFYAAQAAVNGGVAVVGGAPFGPPGKKPEEDERVLSFMNERVHLLPEKNRAMFSPAVVITLRDGRRLAGEYPYQRMEWNFDELAVQLQRCVPGYPGGKAALDRLIKVVRASETHAGVAPLLQACRPA